MCEGERGRDEGKKEKEQQESYAVTGMVQVYMYLDTTHTDTSCYLYLWFSLSFFSPVQKNLNISSNPSSDSSQPQQVLYDVLHGSLRKMDVSWGGSEFSW